MMTQDLRTVLLALDAHVIEHGYTPSVRELAKRIGRSATWTFGRLCELRDTGWITSGKPGSQQTWAVVHPGISRAVHFGASLAQTFDDIDAMKAKVGP